LPADRDPRIIARKGRSEGEATPKRSAVRFQHRWGIELKKRGANGNNKRKGDRNGTKRDVIMNIRYTAVPRMAGKRGTKGGVFRENSKRATRKLNQVLRRELVHPRRRQREQCPEENLKGTKDASLWKERKGKTKRGGS